MKTLQSDYEKRSNRVIIRYACIALLPIFLLVFFIGKSYSAPEEKGNEENIQQDFAGKVDATMIKKEATPLQVEKRPDGKPIGKVVYLTFDDGPSILTNQFLDVLKEARCKSNIFYAGK